MQEETQSMESENSVTIDMKDVKTHCFACKAKVYNPINPRIRKSKISNAYMIYGICPIHKHETYQITKKSIAEQLIRDKIIPFIDESAESGSASYTSTKPFNPRPTPSKGIPKQAEKKTDQSKVSVPNMGVSKKQNHQRKRREAPFSIFSNFLN